jgi:hypothetical protein
MGVCAFRLPSERKLALPSHEASLIYELAVANYCYTGDRATLYRALVAIGIGRSACRWHAAHPGQCQMVQVQPAHLGGPGGERATRNLARVMLRPSGEDRG